MVASGRTALGDAWFFVSGDSAVLGHANQDPLEGDMSKLTTLINVTKVTRSRNLYIGAGFAALLLGLAVAESALDKTAAAQAQGAVQAPRFEVDPLWPKPLPNHWVLGSTIGVWVDTDDHVWIIHRSSATLANNEKPLEMKTGECCEGAPPVLEFDQAGNLLRHWGGPGEGYEWPDSNHGIFVDYKGNVWIGGNGGADSEILKFTKDGKFLLQVGKKGARRNTTAAAGVGEGQVAGFSGGSNDPLNFGRVAKIWVDQQANEAYISDGYLNKRVAVLDADTGKMKRWWGAYGNKPDDTPMPAYDPSAPPTQQFHNPVHCADMSVDRMIYVCDRVGDRLQVFTPEGKFIKEAFFETNTKNAGSVWDIAFSKDPQQKYIFMADGVNEKVKIVDRQTLKELTTFGDGGRQPGQFYGVHSIAIDSKGNLYTTETYEGKRLQRFLNKGMAPVTRMNQGALAVWPGSK
jgi:DNA-binding beta-propeller fold protein YncE